MKIGDKLLIARKTLGLNKAKMAAGIIDSSYYARVEKGLSRISSVELIQILQEHHISIVGFLSGLGDVQPRVKLYQDQILEAFNKKDRSKLQKIKNDPELNYVILRKIVAGMIQNLSVNDKKENLPEDLKTYFSNIDYWSEYDFWNLWVCFKIYNPEDLCPLAEISLIHFARNNYGINDEDKIRLVANIAMVNLEAAHQNNESEVVAKMIDFLRKLPATNSTFTPKLIGKYYGAVYDQDSIVSNELKAAVAVVKNCK